MRHCVFILAYFLSNFSFGQKPWTLDKIVPKVDSVLEEATLMHKYFNAEFESKKNMSSKFNYIVHDSLVLTYLHNDTIRCIFIDPRTKNSFYETSYIGNYEVPIITKTRHRSLSIIEDSLLTIKRSCLHLIKNDTFLTQPKKNFNFSFALIPEKSYFKFYVLTTTSLDNYIPFGKDYLYKISPNGKIIEKSSFLMQLYPKEIDENAALLILVYKKDPLIFASDICIFNMYKEDLKLNGFTVISRMNRRKFVYNAKSHEVIIQP